MNLDTFADITSQRIPTPTEFVQFVKSQGWKIITKADGAALRVRDTGDPLAVAMAKMLSREPYRTNVLAVAVAEFDLPATPREDVIVSQP